MKLTLKQKIFIALIMVTFSVMIWQIMLMFGEDLNNQTTNTNSHRIISHVSSMIKSDTANNSDLPITLENQDNYKPTAATLADDSKLQAQPIQFTKTQQEYVEMVNQYQLSQMRKVIAEADEAIAIAQRNKASAQVERLSLEKKLSTLVTHDQDSSAAQGIVELQPKGTTNSVSSVTKNKYTLNEQKLLTINPDNYVIQLMFDGDRAAVEEFMKNSKLQSEGYLYKSRRNGQRYYGLVIGDYKSVKEATNIINSLPLSMKTWHPYIRKLREIQDEINNA